MTAAVALVTGASSGIGKAAAEALHRARFEVVGTSRSASGSASPGGVKLITLDVTSDASVEGAVGHVIEEFGRIDVLVNNAGIGITGAAEESSIAQTQSLFDVNTFGFIRMAKAVLPHMRGRGSGRIINVSSVVGFLPQPYMAAYTASKHAIEGWSESVDHEVREHGVRVLLVEPAWTRTGLDANGPLPDTPLAFYAPQRRVFEKILSASLKDGDDPAIVAKTIVTAATAAFPKQRYPAGQLAARLRTLRRLVPVSVFDRQVRKLNQLA
ncbi:oxidoreductase [Streptomyces mirabilis]|uniref:oxidoreductase n=1 Tax=Streptomyces mirabilis TaxID=68239 RepID=UPI0036B68D83